MFGDLMCQKYQVSEALSVALLMGFTISVLNLTHAVQPSSCQTRSVYTLAHQTIWSKTTFLAPCALYRWMRAASVEDSLATVVVLLFAAGFRQKNMTILHSITHV